MSGSGRDGAAGVGRGLAVAAAVALLGCRPPAQVGIPGRPRYLDYDLPPAVRAADLVGRMTPAEKLGQLETSAPAIPRLGVPSYDWWSEAAHGVARAGRATVFPQAIALAATFDEGLVREVARAISDEARAKFNQAQQRGEHGRYQGLTFFTPNLNLLRDPRWGRAQETFGEDPLLIARIGTAFIRGLQGDDPRHLQAAATAKHFAVHSGPEAARHVFDARPSPHDLADTYLPQFEAAVREAGVASVMAAYNRVDGAPATASQMLLGETLRGRWGFDGYVVGDCGAIEDIFGSHHTAPSAEAAAAAALAAGTDLDCGSGFHALGRALGAGLVTEDQVSRAAIRLFTARFRLGLFDPPSLVPWSNISASVIESPIHLALARDAAERAVVLLENHGGVLPLAAGLRRIAVVGPTADDVPVLLGNYNGTPSHPVTLLDGIRAAAHARGVAVDHARGADLTDASDGDIASALDAARQAEVVIAVVGLDPRLEGEEGEPRLNRAGDRADLDLPRAQRRLLAALVGVGKPVVAVVTGGSAVAVSVPGLAAIAYAFYPGAEGGNAIARVLFGDANPAGRLPFTIYRSVDDLPPFADYAMAGRTYRYFDRPVLYPFGHGLSYTRFQYADLTVTPDPAGGARLSVDLQNVGPRAGDEVVQVYVLPESPPAGAPRRWLAAFARVALAPGARTVVRLELPPRALSLVDDAGARRPLAGAVTIAVGGGQPDRAGGYSGEPPGATTRLVLSRPR